MAADQTLLVLITLAVMLVGMVGVVIPVLPDVWLIWLAALGYGLLREPPFDGWTGGVAMLLLTILTLIGMAVDLVLSTAGAKRGGASWQGILASLGLGLAGLFFFPPFGALAGALLGLFLVEYSRYGGDFDRAWRAVKGYAAGCGLSVVVRLAISGLMIVIWGVWVWLARS